MTPFSRAAGSTALKLPRTVLISQFSSKKTLAGSPSTKVKSEKNHGTAQSETQAPDSEVLASASQTPASGPKNSIDQRTTQASNSFATTPFSCSVLAKVAGATTLTILQRQQQAESDSQSQGDSGESPSKPKKGFVLVGPTIDRSYPDYSKKNTRDQFRHQEGSTIVGTPFSMLEGAMPERSERIPEIAYATDEQSALACLEGTPYEGKFSCATQFKDGTWAFGKPVQTKIGLAYPVMVTRDGVVGLPGDKGTGSYGADGDGARTMAFMKGLKVPENVDFGKHPNSFGVLNAPQDKIDALRPHYNESGRVDKALTFWREMNVPWLELAIASGTPIVSLTELDKRVLFRKAGKKLVRTGYGNEIAKKAAHNLVYHQASGEWLRADTVQEKRAKGENLVLTKWPDGLHHYTLLKPLVLGKHNQLALRPSRELVATYAPTVEQTGKTIIASQITSYVLDQLCKSRKQSSTSDSVGASTPIVGQADKAVTESL